MAKRDRKRGLRVAVGDHLIITAAGVEVEHRAVVSAGNHVVIAVAEGDVARAPGVDGAVAMLGNHRATVAAVESAVARTIRPKHCVGAD